MITLEQLKKRRQTVDDDIKKVEEAIADLDARRQQLQANLYALQGASQQIEHFMELETDEEKEDE
jgi:prefoldin subunit 5|tara:strand:+ start:259 stop:453 length:195 start_codon:yes stop_codon:yes gene_type:complete